MLFWKTLLGNKSKSLFEDRLVLNHGRRNRKLDAQAPSFFQQLFQSLLFNLFTVFINLFIYFLCHLSGVYAQQYFQVLRIF